MSSTNGSARAEDELGAAAGVRAVQTSGVGAAVTLVHTSDVHVDDHLAPQE